MSEYISYGDQVFIELSLLHTHSDSQARLLCSNAFLDDAVYAVKASNYQLADFRSCIFTILPPLVNNQDDLSFIESLGNELSLLSGSSADYKKGREYLEGQLEDRKGQLEGMKENIHVLNVKLAEEKAQKPVRYGEAVVLQHLESGSFLSVEISRNVRATNLNGLRLKKEATPGCYFRIHSTVTEHQKGPIEYTREINLVSVQLGTALAMSEPEDIRPKLRRKSSLREPQEVDILTEENKEKYKDIEEEDSPNSPEIVKGRREYIGTIEDLENARLLVRGSENDEIDLEEGPVRGRKGIESFDEEKYEVGTSVESEAFSRIRIFEYCSKKLQREYKQGQVIKSGDYIRLELENMYVMTAKSSRDQFVSLYGAYKDEWKSHNLVDSVFQVISYHKGGSYPKGRDLKSVPKKKAKAGDDERIILKHMMSGQYLTIPEKGLVNIENEILPMPMEEIMRMEDQPEEGLQEIAASEHRQGLAYFKFVNNDLKAQKNVLRKGVLVQLLVFEEDNPQTKWYMTSEEENKDDTDNIFGHFLGKGNTTETLQGVLQIKNKSLISSEGAGRFFSIEHVEEVEVKRLMSFDWYGRVLSNFEEIMREIIFDTKSEETEKNLIQSLKKVYHVSKRLLDTLKGSEGDIKDLLSGFEGDVQTYVREFKILDSVCRLLWWFFVKQSVRKLLRQEGQSGNLDIERLVKLIENLILIVYESTKNNIVSYVYVARYLKVFLMSLFSSSSLLNRLPKDYRETLKGHLIVLLSNLLSDQTLHNSPMITQLNTYQDQIFLHVDSHSDYSPYVLQLLTWFFNRRSADAQTTLLHVFYSRYLSNQSETQGLFPQLKSTSRQQEFQILFKRTGYPEAILISNASKEVLDYLYWSFALLNALLDSGSLRIKYAVMKYYDIWVCWDLIHSQKVPGKIKSKVLGVIRKAHLGYKKLPFEKIPRRLQFNIRSDLLESYTEAFEASIKETNQGLLREIEADQLEGTSLQKEGTWKASMQGLRGRILKDKIEDISQGRLDEVAFGLEVMVSLLDSEIEVDTDEVLRMYHCVAELVSRAAQQITGQEAGNKEHYQALEENYGQILNLLGKIDQYTVRLAVKEILVEIRGVIEGSGARDNFVKEVKDKQKVTESQIEHIFKTVCGGWKSKEKLYNTSKISVYAERYSDSTLRKALWKVLEVEPSGFAGGIINLLRRKVGFEAEVTEELAQYVFITKEKDLRQVVELAAIVLSLHKATRRLQAEVEFEEEEVVTVENTQVLEEIIRNLENIILIVYDYEGQIGKEQGLDGKKGARRMFLERLARSKERKAGKSTEVPFEYRTKYIKKDFQKVMMMFNTHKVVLSLLHYLYEPDLFGVNSEDDRLAMAAGLIGVILRLFVDENVQNKYVIGRYDKFLRIFFEKAKATSSLEFLGVFSEVCQENKTLVNMQEITLYRVTLAHFLNFLESFSLVNNEKLADSYLPVTILSNSQFLFLAHLPKEQFEGVRMMNNIRSDLLDFLKVDRRLALNRLLRQIPEESKEYRIEVPPLYSLLKEFWKLEVWLATSEKKENVLIMQSRFTGPTLKAFLVNNNLVFNMELKKELLGAFDILHFKTQYPNYEVFESEDTLDEILGSLLVDVYWYLKQKRVSLKEDSHLLDVLENGILLKTNKHIMKKYKDQIANKPKGLESFESIEFLEYQSVSNFGSLWRDYINYLLSDFMYTLVDNYRRHFTIVKTKTGDIKTLFELWARLLVRVRDLDDNKEYFQHINLILRRAMVLSEYSEYRGYVIQNIEAKEKEHKKYIEEEEGRRRDQENREEKQSLEAVKIKEAIKTLEKYFESDSHYKWKVKLENLLDVSRDMEKRRGLITQLVKLLKRRTTSAKDIRFIIRVLRRIIEFEIITTEGPTTNNNINKPIYLWKPLHSESYQHMRGIQNLMNDNNIVEAIFELLYRHTDNLKLTREALILSITLLYGGNKYVQESFHNFFKADFENTILEHLSDVLQDTIDDLLSLEELRLKKNYFQALKFLFKYFGEHDPKSIKAMQVQEEAKLEVATRFSQELEPSNKKYGIRTKSYRLVLVIISFLEMLCEGHNSTFQEFLRDQRICGHTKSFDVLSFMKEMYQEYYRNLSRFNIELGIKGLDLMIGMQQGPSKANNDILLTESMIYTLFNTLYARNTSSDLDLLARGFELDPNEENYLILKQKASILLSGIFEKGEADVQQSMSKYIDFKLCVQTIMQNMTIFYRQKTDNLKIKYKGGFVTKLKNLNIDIDDLWNPYFSMSLRMYIILRYISIDEPHETLSNAIRQAIAEVSLQGGGNSDIAVLCVPTFDLLEKYTASIEIYNNKSGHVSRIFFPVSADFYYLTDETRNNFIENVDRSNTQTKIMDLMLHSEHLMSHMEMEYFSRYRFLGLNYNTMYDYLRDFTHIVAVIVAAVNLVSLDEVNGRPVQSLLSFSIEVVLTGIQILVSFLILALWIITRLTKRLTKCWESRVTHAVHHHTITFFPVHPGATEGVIHTLKNGRIVLMLKGPNLEQSIDILSMRFLPINLYFLAGDATLLWHLIYFFICLTSLLHPVLSALQLLDIAFTSDTVSRISAVIWHNAQSFVWTITMLLIAVYIYTIVGFYFLQGRFTNDTYGHFCSDTYECFIAVLNLGLRSGGGIAEQLEPVPYDPTRKIQYLVHALFDLSFYVIIILMLLNFIFGMIIDAFVELRNRKNKIEEDKKNVCFICGIQRSEYERYANFDKHIENDHNYWHYIAYLLYLRHKSTAEPTELTDTESYVIDRYLDKDTIWIPIGRSVTLEKQKERKERKIENDSIEDQVKVNVEKYMKHMETHMEGLRGKIKLNLKKISKHK